MTDITTGKLRRRDSHLWVRQLHDHYVEPEWVSRRLFQEEKFKGLVWDPACGIGRIALEALGSGLQMRASDIADRGFASKKDLHQGDCPPVLDFLTEVDASNKSWRVDNIVTNPPFGLAREFAVKALALATEKVAILFPTARLNAAHWLRETPLHQIWLLSPRPSMPPGEVIARGEKPNGGKTDFCWLVWWTFAAKKPKLDWLHRDE